MLAAVDTAVLINEFDGLVGNAARSFESVAQTSGAPFLLAVSGGSDSLALLHLFARWADGKVPASVVTVDHRLRPEAAAEAEFVGDQCRALGLPHTTLTWERPNQGEKATQAAARVARYRFLAAHAKKLGAPSVLLGHTQNDQLETLRMRLGRLGAAQYAALGTSGIAAEIHFGGVSFHRPLLEIRRDSLRQYLLGQGALDWVEDPSNSDGTYERVRVRQQTALSESAQLLRFQKVAARWRALVEREALTFVRAGVTPGLHHVRFERRAFVQLPEAVQRFVLGCAIAAIGGAGRRADGAGFVRDLRRLTNDRTGFAMAGALVDHRRTHEILVYPEVRDSHFQAQTEALERLGKSHPQLPFEARRAIAWRQLHPVPSLQSWCTAAENRIFSHLAAHDTRSR